MQISVTFRNIHSSEGIKSYASKKLKRLPRFLGTDNMEANLVLSVEKYRHIAELNLWADGEKIYSKEEADDIYAAIDKVVDKIERQLNKLKEKRIPRHTGETTSVEPGVPAGPQIIKSDSFSPKPMDIEEAVEQMEVTGAHLLVFINADTKKVCVLHKRDDGNYDLVEPNF